MTKQELLDKHAKQLAELEQEEAIRAQLPEEIREKARICLHRDHASVSAAWDSYNEKKRQPCDARRVISQVESLLVQGEHWKAGTISTYPAEINSNAKNENATMDGSYIVEVKVEGGRGYGPNVEIRCWLKLPEGQLIELTLPIQQWQLVPNVRATYNNHGDLASCTITWPVWRQTCDSFRQWWSEKPAYSGSYYSADLPNYDAWMSSIH